MLVRIQPPQLVPSRPVCERVFVQLLQIEAEAAGGRSPRTTSTRARTPLQVVSRSRWRRTAAARTVWSGRNAPACGASAPFRPPYRYQRYCLRACGTRAPRPNRGKPNHKLRRVDRPPYEQLLREIAETSYLAVGRKYGVSDNAIRKWVRQYERERAP